ncbi:hypothetical protein ACET3Z_032295 [Daucus carota]
MSAEDLFAEFDRAVESEAPPLMPDPSVAPPPPPRPTLGELQVLITELQARIRILERRNDRLEDKIDELREVVRDLKVENSFLRDKTDNDY